ncbi:Protein LURP-one-related 15 [Cardamine amara subsp. amara]|uniref:Protein LURP-one-related 15 n=1 Tax=Cardamine amara subsp. amara TaxID=228776 RepID=A0ABD0ZL86_CARAN
MAGPSAPQGSGVTGVIVDPRFCVSYPVEMAIVRKVMKLKGGNFVITDVNGNMMFKVKDPLFGLHDKRILLDSSGAQVLTLREKIMSMHSRWQVLRGGSKQQGDLLYTVKKTSMVQLIRTKLEVFLSHNKEEKTCDFRVRGNWSESSCVVYAGESDTIVAQMQKNDTWQSTLWGKDNYTVTAYPNVDYAFIASLIVILHDINCSSSLPILDMGTSLLLN